jgi:hypothetical protein
MFSLHFTGHPKVCSNLAVDLLLTQRSPAQHLCLAPSSSRPTKIIPRGWKEGHPEYPGFPERLPAHQVPIS